MPNQENWKETFWCITVYTTFQPVLQSLLCNIHDKYIKSIKALDTVLACTTNITGLWTACLGGSRSPKPVFYCFCFFVFFAWVPLGVVSKPVHNSTHKAEKAICRPHSSLWALAGIIPCGCQTLMADWLGWHKQREAEPSPERMDEMSSETTILCSETERASRI